MTRKITIILLGLMALLASAASCANVLTVNTYADQSGSCSLRDAIMSSNTLSSVGGCPTGTGSDTIQLSSGTYTLNSSIQITANITVQGAATTNNGNLDPLLGSAPTRTLPTTTITLASGAADRLFVVTNSGSGSFIDLYLVGGKAAAKNDPYQQNGGAVWAAATISFENVQLNNNTAPGQGGAVFLSGPGSGINATLTSFENNQAASGSSAVGSTCYSAQAAESHTYNLNQDLFYKNTALTSPTVLAPAVQGCGDVTLSLTNDTFAFNDVGIALTGSNSLVSVNAASVTLSQLTIIGQNGVGIDLSGAVGLSTISVTDSVIAFNGGSGSFRNCTSAQALSNASTSSTIGSNATGHGCSLTDGYSTNSPDEQSQAYSALDGGVYSSGTTVNPNFSRQFYLPNPSNPGQFAPPGYGGLTGVYFPTPPASGGILVDGTKKNCATSDQRGATRNVDGDGCTLGAVEPKKLYPSADSGQNLSSAGAARTVSVAVLGNDQADETGAGADGTRYSVARVHAFDPSSCINLNGGSAHVSSDGTQIIYQPAQPLVSWNGQQVTGPGTLTASAVVCSYYIQDNANPSNVSQQSATVTMTVSDIPPVAVNISYTRPYNGNPFSFNPLTGDSDPDGINGQLPPEGKARASNVGTALQSTDCSGRRLMQISTQPALGTLTGNVMALVVSGSNLTTYYDGNMTYTPSNSFSPFSDSFQYAVLDADCVASNTATVTINTSAPSPSTGSGSLDGLMLTGGLTLLLLRSRYGARRQA